MDVRGKRIIVTGGFGALGRCVSQALGSAGAGVGLLDHAAAPATLDGALRLLGGVDLSDPGAARKAIDRLAGDLGGLDGLVNVAGGFRWETLADGHVETWDLLYRMNVRTSVCASQAALAHLAKGGAIVNVAAGAALRAGAGMGPYAAAKAGVMRLTEALAEEYKARLRVNAVLPSVIDTPANRRDMPDADFSSWVQPEEIAAVIQFLLSDAARGVTGALISVPGRV
jgi:NAD(P)-dependent dehydrogenase (short-subunit alcohol dehydrogenase family)